MWAKFYLSIIHAAGNGAIIVPIFIKDTIHELSSGVITTGESSWNSFGNDGEFHPKATAAANKNNVAIKKKLCSLHALLYYKNETQKSKLPEMATTNWDI